MLVFSGIHSTFKIPNIHNQIVHLFLSVLEVVNLKKNLFNANLIPNI